MIKTEKKGFLILLTLFLILWQLCCPGSAEMLSTKEPPEELPAEDRDGEETAGTTDPDHPDTLADLFFRQESASLIAQNVIYDGKKILEEYSRPASRRIRMQGGNYYSKAPIGVMTFRGSAFRQNAAFGNITKPDTMQVLWRTETGGSGDLNGKSRCAAWMNQPAIVKWSYQVRLLSDVYEEKQKKEGMLEVIDAGEDGVIRFLDLDDGSPTRSPVYPDFPMAGSPSLHPGGFPYMTAGCQLEEIESRTGKTGLLQYNLYNSEEIPGDILLTGSVGSSSLIDRTSDSVISLDGNGLLCLTSLNTYFDYETGILETHPSSVVLASRAEGEKENGTAVLSSHAMYDRYVFYADLSGVLRCVDTDTLTPVWAAETGDAVLAAVALDQPGADTLDLYTANTLRNRESGDAQIRRYDAVNGKEIWCTGIGVSKADGTDTGCVASPVIGEHTLQHLAFFTVNGLNEEGRNFLGVQEDAGSAVAAFEKETGRICWAAGLRGESVSSPVAVYDEDGNGWIVQCASDGTIVLLEGLTGIQTASLILDGRIEASPAVHRNRMVIRTTGAGGENAVYGIYIGNHEDYEKYAEKASPAESPAPVPENPGNVRTDTDLMLDRMVSFFSCWSANRLDEMLTYCIPGWTGENGNPRTSLFALLANRTPQSLTILEVSGAEREDGCSVTVSSMMDRNNGRAAVLYRMTVRMVRTGGEWYVDPESLRTYDIREDTEPDKTPEPAQTRFPETGQPAADSDLRLYWNPAGGEYYHTDPNCRSVNPKYTPLSGVFSYAEVNEDPYCELKPCVVCEAPQRP